MGNDHDSNVAAWSARTIALHTQQMEHELLSIPGHLGVKAAAARLGVSDKRILQYLAAGSLPAKKVSGRQMIPVAAVEAFQRRPAGRLRSDPVPWKAYRTSEVCLLHLTVGIQPAARDALQVRVQAMIEQQQALFKGTMQRYFCLDEDEQESTLHIMLIWKETELTDRSALLREIEQLKIEWATVLTWNTSQFTVYKALAHT